MPKLTSAGTAFRHLKRYQQVVRVLVKYSFSDLVDQLRLWEEANIGKRISHRRGRQFAHLPHAQRVPDSRTSNLSGTAYASGAGYGIYPGYKRLRNGETHC